MAREGSWSADHKVQLWVVAIATIGTIVVALINGYEKNGGGAQGSPQSSPSTASTPSESSSASEPPDSETPDVPSPTAVPSASKTAIDVNWQSTAGEQTADIGTTILFKCPPGGIPQTIWGDKLYTSDSSVCTAAVHDGRIPLDAGGSVIIVIREGAQSYAAADRHDITSLDFGNFGSSFEFTSPPSVG